MGYKGRDVEVIQIDEGKCIVIACDSCGAIGSKEFDLVKVEPYIVGRFTARVALFEIISVGAVPIAISAAVSNEPDPTGEGILNGIRDELSSINLKYLPIEVSTEKNMETRQTGLGVTAVGICEKNKLKIASSMPKDYIYCLGIPKVGNEVRDPDDPEIAKGKYIYELLNIDGVHDIVPVGSKGICKEAEMLADSVGCRFIKENHLNIDIFKSAGPSTCLIFSCSPDTELSDFRSAAIIKIGELV